MRQATWFEVGVHSAEDSLQSLVPEVEVDPLGGAEQQDRVVLGHHRLCRTYL